MAVRHEACATHRLQHQLDGAATFRDAAIEGVIEQTPCILTSAQLGPLVDKDPEWRDGAKYTREKAETIISDERIPFDRRLYYAFTLLAGLRPVRSRRSGGATSIQRSRRSVLTVALALNTRKLSIKGTKRAPCATYRFTRRSPLIAEWKLSGWVWMIGREPKDDDLRMPLPLGDAKARRTREGEPLRTGDYAGKKRREVGLKTLGWREREMYAMKATFVTLCGKDGAKRDAIQRITHAKAKRDAFDGYDRDAHWDEMCAEIAKLRLARKPVNRGSTLSLAT